MRREHLVTREQEHAPHLRGAGKAQHGVEAVHPQHGIALQTIDEEIEILHGKDHARLSALQGAVIRLHAFLRALLLARRKARDFPRLLAKTRGKQLLQEARQPCKHHFFRPCTHILVSGSIRLTFAHHPTQQAVYRLTKDFLSINQMANMANSVFIHLVLLALLVYMTHYFMTSLYPHVL